MRLSFSALSRRMYQPDAGRESSNLAQAGKAVAGDAHNVEHKAMTAGDHQHAGDGQPWPLQEQRDPAHADRELPQGKAEKTGPLAVELLQLRDGLLSGDRRIPLQPDEEG